MRESGNGASSATSINLGGSLSLAQLSNPLNHPEAKINSAARAVYSAMFNGLADYDHATVKLKHKSRTIAIAVLDAAERFENHYP